MKYIILSEPKCPHCQKRLINLLYSRTISCQVFRQLQRSIHRFWKIHFVVFRPSACGSTYVVQSHRNLLTRVNESTSIQGSPACKHLLADPTHPFQIQWTRNTGKHSRSKQVSRAWVAFNTGQIPM